jgi:hypothetical protein
LVHGLVEFVLELLALLDCLVKVALVLHAARAAVREHESQKRDESAL